MLLDKGYCGPKDHIVGANATKVRRRANAREAAMRVGFIAGLVEAVVSLLVVWPIAGSGNYDDLVGLVMYGWIITCVAAGFIAGGSYLGYQRLALRRDIAAGRIVKIPEELVGHYVQRAKDAGVPEDVALEVIDKYFSVFQSIRHEELYELWQSRSGTGKARRQAGERINHMLAPVVAAAKQRHRELLEVEKRERAIEEAGLRKRLELLPPPEE